MYDKSNVTFKYTQLLRLVGRLGFRKSVLPIDRPKSVGNLCVIEVFGGVFVLSLNFQFLTVWWLLSCDIGQISSFLGTGVSRPSAVRKTIYIFDFYRNA